MAKYVFDDVADNRSIEEQVAEATGLDIAIIQVANIPERQLRERFELAKTLDHPVKGLLLAGGLTVASMGVLGVIFAQVGRGISILKTGLENAALKNVARAEAQKSLLQKCRASVAASAP